MAELKNLENAPESQSGDENEGKIFTADEVKRKLRGSGKQIETLQTRLAELEAEAAARAANESAAEQKLLAEQGKFKELFAQAEEKRKKSEERLNELLTKEQERLTRIAESNKKRVEALPQDLKILVPDGLAPDAASEQIARVEALIAKKQISVSTVGGGRSKEENTPAALADKGRSFIFGK